MDELEQIALLKENIPVYCLVSPIEIISRDGKRVARLKCVKMELKEPGASPSLEGRRQLPMSIEGSEFEIDADMVIPAVAQSLTFLSSPRTSLITSRVTELV